MKHLATSLCLWLAMTAAVVAQNPIVVSAYVAPNCGVPANSTKILENKLNQIITQNGFGSESNQRFVLTAKVDILSEDITATAPAKFVYTLNCNLYIGDGLEGTLFSSTAVEAKGVGNTRDKAYMMALQQINLKNPDLKAFVKEGKEKIIEYYRLRCPMILKRAQALAATQDFEQALWELSTIPDVCEECFSQASDLMVQIYQTKIDQDARRMLAEATAIWNAGQSVEAAERAGLILAGINPQSSVYPEAAALGKQIADRVRELDNREWNFMVQQTQNDVDIRLEEIRAARDIGVAYGNHQPQHTYNLRTWW